jgi:acetolactate synthase I/II/III large subunit
VIAEALTMALGPPPGPVHIDCPSDEVGTVPLGSPCVRSAIPPVAEGTRLRQVAARSRRPLVIVGLGARRPDDAAATRAFIERRGLPALVTYKAKGVVPDRHASFAGVFTQAQIERPVIDQSDLIIGIGLDPVELLPRSWTYAVPVAYVGRWPVADSHVPFCVQSIGEISKGLDAIDAHLPASEWDLTEIRRHVVASERAIDIATSGLSAQTTLRLTAERLARHARVTVDAGAHMLPATMLWPVHEPGQLLISNGLSTMGFALPAAIGAALLDRSRRVVALTGDGGLLMCAAELLTAARERLQIIVIVFADASLSLIEIKQQRRRLQPAGVALGTVRWPAIAEGFGAAGFVASSASELECALDAALQVEGPSVIEARIDRSNYGGILQAIRG